MQAPRVVRGRRGLGLLAAASVLATAACGSTVQSSGTTALGGAGGAAAEGGAAVGGDGLGGASAEGTVGGSAGTSGGAGTAEASTLSSAVGGGTSSTSAGGAGGSTTGGAAAPGAASGTGGGPAAVANGKLGPGVTAKEIFIGITYTANGDQANAAIGAAISRGDERQNAKAVIDDINERGGVAGRKLVPVFHGYDAQSTETSASQDQAACETFTKDNKVFAVASGGITDVFPACMKKAGVLMMTSGVIIDPDRKFFQEFPSYFNMGTMSQERMMAAQVPSFQRQGYFGGWDTALARSGSAKPKLGVLSLDTPTWNRPLDKVLLPTLARVGHPVDPGLVVRVHNPASNSELGRTVADIQSATLRFRDAGVTHVVVLDATAFITLTFLNNTRQQRYFPRLGANTATGMQALHDTGAIDPQQFNGAVGLGWYPTLDLPAGAADPYLTSATKQCLDNNKKRTGQTFTSTNAATLALNACDVIYTFAAGFAKAGQLLNLATATAGLESLGAIRTANIAGGFLGPGRHDGLEIAFDLYWDSACTCAKYRGKGLRVAS